MSALLVKVTLLLVAGVLFAIFIALLSDYNEQHWLPSVRWFELLAFTLMLFGDVIRRFRPYWRRATFWAAIVGLLAAHTSGYAVLLTHVEEWRVIWFVPLSIAELLGLLWLLRVLGYDGSSLAVQRKNRAVP